MIVPHNTLAPVHTNLPPRTLNFRVKYKTEKCRYLLQQGHCPFGSMCAFAHDTFEIRNKSQLHARYKTKPCLNYTRDGYCKYGERCLFLHDTQVRDRERTRSNSPQQPENHAQSSNPHHQQNIKILAQYGFAVFEAHMNRKSSRILEWKLQEDCQLTNSSTEPEHLEHTDISAYKNAIESIPTSSIKKGRMYSL